MIVVEFEFDPDCLGVCFEEIPEPAVCAAAVKDVELDLLFSKVEEVTANEVVTARGVENDCDVTTMEDEDAEEATEDT